MAEDHGVPDRAAAGSSGILNSVNIPANEPALLCYLDLSINEMDYHFNSQTDLILFNETENAIIYFENEASTKFGWLNFNNQVPDNADMIEFFEPAAGTFLILFKKSNAVYPVTLTAYSNKSEFITGHYAGIYTDAMDNPVYNVSCKFNICRDPVVKILNAESAYLHEPLK